MSPTPNTKIAVDNAFQSLDYALRRDASREVYAQVHERIKGMVAYDRDLEHVARWGIDKRYEALLHAVKDFATFLENYVAQVEESAERDLHP